MNDLTARILDQLRLIPEPCSIAMGSEVNLVQMGLVDGIEIDEGDVTVTLCLTDASCIHFRAMQRFIADGVLALPGVSKVSVLQTADKIWTADRMTP